MCVRYPGNTKWGEDENLYRLLGRNEYEDIYRKEIGATRCWFAGLRGRINVWWRRLDGWRLFGVEMLSTKMPFVYFFIVTRLDQTLSLTFFSTCFVQLTSSVLLFFLDFFAFLRRSPLVWKGFGILLHTSSSIFLKGCIPHSFVIWSYSIIIIQFGLSFQIVIEILNFFISIINCRTGIKSKICLDRNKIKLKSCLLG